MLSVDNNSRSFHLVSEKFHVRDYLTLYAFVYSFGLGNSYYDTDRKDVFWTNECKMLKSQLFKFKNIHIKGDVGQALPFVIFGGLSFLAGIMALVLPETLGVNLPDTIREAEQFGK